MINLEKKFSMCDYCGIVIPTKEIYVDYSIDEFTGLCREHFYKKYGNNIKGYYNLVKFFDGEIISEEEFQTKRKCETGIHYEFNFPEDDYGVFDDDQKERFRNITYNDIMTDKAEYKFDIISFETKEHYSDNIFTLHYDLKVFFKSYLEYLENQLFLSLRSHFISEYLQSLKHEKSESAVIC